MKKLAVFLVLSILLIATLLHSAERMLPREYGVYVKTPKKLIRLMPNIVFDQEGLYYIESLSPPRLLLKDVEYFIIFGDYNMDVLTLNPMQFLKNSPVGKPRFIFGKEIPVEVKQLKEKMYQIKAKGLLGRGYFSLWIEDSAWDFIID